MHKEAPPTHDSVGGVMLRLGMPIASVERMQSSQLRRRLLGQYIHIYCLMWSSFPVV